MSKRIRMTDEERFLAFAQDQDIAVVETIIRLMQGVIKRRKALAEKMKDPNKYTEPKRRTPKPEKGQQQAKALTGASNDSAFLQAFGSDSGVVGRSD